MSHEITIGFTWDGQGIGADESVSLGLEFDEQWLVVHVDAPFHGDPSPDRPPGRCPRLWEHEVVELFLVGASEQYLELELGPAGHWLALRFAGIRRLADDAIDLRYSAAIEGPRWRGRACVAARSLPRPLARWNAFAIHGSGEHRRYLAATAIGGSAPDFHRIHDFPRWAS